MEHRPGGDPGVAEPDAERRADHPIRRGPQGEPRGPRQRGLQGGSLLHYMVSSHEGLLLIHSMGLNCWLCYAALDDIRIRTGVKPDSLDQA